MNVARIENIDFFNIDDININSIDDESFYGYKRKPINRLELPQIKKTKKEIKKELEKKLLLQKQFIERKNYFRRKKFNEAKLTKESVNDFFEYKNGLIFYKNVFDNKCIKTSIKFGGLYIKVHELIFFIHHNWVPAKIVFIDKNQNNRNIENLIGYTQHEWSILTRQNKFNKTKKETK